MRPLSDHVSSLLWSQKLKELGVCQDQSQFYWVNAVAGNLPNGLPDSIEGEFLLPRIEAFNNVLRFKNEPRFSMVAAFLSSELGLALGEGFHTELSAETKTWWCWKPFSARPQSEDTEPNAKSSMLAHLLETGVISVQDVNRRLSA